MHLDWLTRRWIAAAIIALLAVGAKAQAVPPDVVKLPASISGGSSFYFYDGFGRTDPGWVPCR
jgi:hypothetical protein